MQQLGEKKAEYLNQIDEFNILYSIKLGDIIQKTLEQKEKNLSNYLKDKKTIANIKSKIRKLKKELNTISKDSVRYEEIIQEYTKLKIKLEKLENRQIKKDETREKIAENILSDEQLNEQWEDIKSNFENFKKVYEDSKDCFSDIKEINEDEKAEIKTLWKKAHKLCHPDIVSDELKTQANKIAQSLNEAYARKDLKKIKEILNSLEKGMSFTVSSDSINDIEILKNKIEQYKENIFDINNDLKYIKEDETFITIKNIYDMDKYFKEKRVELEENYEYIKKYKIID